MKDAEHTELRATEKELAQANEELASELGRALVDAVGVIDPTPISDSIGAAMSLCKGDLVGAGLSLLSIVPYVGDAVGKTAKGARTVTRLNKLRKRIAGLIAKAEKLRASRKATDAAQEAITAAKKVPNVPRKVAVECTEGTTSANFIGKLRGKRVELPSVKTKRIRYTKRSREDYRALRREFDSRKRDEFVKGLADDPKKAEALKQAGLTDAEIKHMKDGEIPEGWQVHHKLPLDNGGTNDPSNLVLIKTDPSHLVITNAQDDLVGGLAVGQTRTVDFPVPDGFVYPAKATTP